MNTLEAYIAHHAQKQPDKLAVICGTERCTYADLQARIETRMVCPSMLQECCSSGTIVPLRAESTIDFLVTYFALHRLGLVAAPLERDMPEEAFQRVTAELTAHTCPEGTADVLYTTGTTGRSKGVMVSHKVILADAENLIAGQGFTPDTIFVVNGPLNHIGSLSKVYPVMLLGATLIIVDGLKDLNAFFNAFELESLRSEVKGLKSFATFLVPASVRILLQLASDRLAALADRLDFIETGAAAMAQSDMEALCRLLPDTRLYNTYASTETGIICTHDFHSGPCTPGCLGRPMPHSGVHITEAGLIACTGDTLMTGYVGEPERTAQVLRDGVLYTADLGTIDADGRLHLQGREDDVINVGGFKVAPTEVEDAAMSHPSVADCLCISVDHKITGRALKLLVVLTEGATLDKRALARYLSTRLEPYKVPMLYEQVGHIRRTFNGKPDRKSYAVGHTK
ncbi:MAG: acyl--CoA ligase [Prevotella sp.]|nr:acyl--CoA ligase [Prevotella sp.]